MSQSVDFDLKKIKLIVWDLDDTFWKGTLSEESVELIAKNVELLKLSTARGIINSICSKNDIDAVKEKLIYDEIWEYFVFPSVDWTPKGMRLKQQILDMALRAENVLFIDDNLHNIEEVKFANPGIMTATPDVIECILDNILTLGKDDKEHTRLKQYRVMELKHSAKENSANNYEFLLSSGINVEIFHDCLTEKDRISEMIQRTNQLNYTKNRIDDAELECVLNNADYECGYVRVKDNFGEYGISGFYALKDNYLEHFLFSCRVLGMGVEQYIYAELGFPNINTVGSVAVELDSSQRPNWINVKSKSNSTNNSLKIDMVDKRILIKGPCDMLSIFSYIKGNDEMIDTEFAFISSKSGASVESYNHTEHIVNALRLSSGQKKRIIDDVPFGDDKLYETSLFHNGYSIIFLSLLLDASMAVYRRKETGETVCFGHCNDDFTNPDNWNDIISGKIYAANCKFDRVKLEKFKDGFEYCGRMSVDDVVSNVAYILNALSSDTKLVLITGSEVEYIYEDNHNLTDIHLYYRELNQQLLKLKVNYSNIEVISFTKYIDSQECFYNSSNHFSKKVYFGLANDMVSIINELIDAQLKKPSKVKLWLEQGIRNIARIIPSKKLLRKLYYLFKLKKK